MLFRMSCQHGSGYSQVKDKQKCSAKADQTTDGPASFNDNPGLVDTKNNEQFKKFSRQGYELLNFTDDDQPASESADRSEADSENQTSPLLRRSSRELKRREITQTEISEVQLGKVIWIPLKKNCV